MAEFLLGARVRLRIGSEILSLRLSFWTATNRYKLSEMYMTDLDHRSTGFYTALIVLAVPAIPAMPGVRALNHPAFLQRREAFRARRTRLHFEAPVSTIRSHPGVQGMVVILLIRKDRDETRKVVGRDGPEQGQGRPPIIETGTGNEDGEQ